MILIELLGIGRSVDKRNIVKETVDMMLTIFT